jgi:formate hydrogenlyase subunit 3/multisubunit Na+/H+ antiporter MnhD subunit
MPASAVLSGAIVKAGVIGMIRFLPAEAVPPAWGAAIAALGFLTAFWGVGCGVTQRNPKTVLAYSTVSQMGVVAAALGMGLLLGIATTPISVAFYGLHHLLAKGALFLAVGVAAACGGRARWWVLAPALVLALGFGGLPPTGGALAKAAVKPELGEGVAGALAALSAIGSTALMLHFMRRLAGMPEGEGSPAPGLLLPWLVLAAAAVVLPWVLFVPAGGDLGSALSWPSLVEAAWPVALGALLALALARWDARLPEVPEGDVILLAQRASGPAARIGDALVKLETLIRPWPVVGVAMLGLALLLVAVMASAYG